MAYILHIDSSADTGLTAISNNGKVVGQVLNTETRNHAATINLHIEQVVKQAGIELKDLSVISVCGGPGSYTGLRIGLSTAKGLCYVLNKPLLLHNKLTLLATQTAYSKKYENILSILQARDKEYFVAVHNSNLDELVKPQHVFEDDLMALLNGYLNNVCFVGFRNEFLQGLADEHRSDYLHDLNPNIDSWAQYAFDCYNRKDFANLEYCEPFYLKQVYTHKPKNSN